MPLLRPEPEVRQPQRAARQGRCTAPVSYTHLTLPTIFVYEGHAGGVGITERGFDCFAEWAGDTARLLERCPCRAGCPSCVQSPKCGNLNELLDKAAARTLLERMTVAGG